MKCPKCGKETPSDGKYCWECGEELSSGPVIMPIDKKIKCKNCGHDNAENSQHCENCGKDPSSSTHFPKAFLRNQATDARKEVTLPSQVFKSEDFWDWVPDERVNKIISSPHFEIRYRIDNFFIVDTKPSANGTYLNNKERLGHNIERQLNNGDTVTLGILSQPRLTMKFEIE